MIRFTLTIFVAAALVFAPACKNKPADGGGAKSAKKFLTGGDLVFSDDFERSEAGENWKLESPSWRIVDGWLHDDHAKNAGAWLNRELPERVRIEFKTRSEMPATGGFRGDTKCEVFCERQAHQAGYVLIFGGWENTINTIARLDEHGKDRLEEHTHRVIPGKVYTWTIIRTDGTLHWYLDGKPFMQYDDREPVPGRYFGFNNWISVVFYDDVKIYKL